jgi:hypothetical protein
MPSTRRNNKRKNGGGWSQGPPLSPAQYYLSENKAYIDCYPVARPGSIQTNPNPELAQTAMAGGTRHQRMSRRNRTNNRMIGGNSCAEYFRTRGGSRCGCGIKMRGGAHIYGECPYKANSFDCPYAHGGARSCRRKTRRMKGGRYGIAVGENLGGSGPNVAPVTVHVPCEGVRPMPLNPHNPTQLVSGPDPGLKFAGLTPAAVGGARRKGGFLRRFSRKYAHSKNG